MDYKSTLMWKELNEAKDVLKTLRERNAGVLQSVAAAAEKAGVANVYTAGARHERPCDDLSEISDRRQARHTRSERRRRAR